MNGPTARQGRVEFCRNNIWGTVCDDFWGVVDARVVCSQLNYDGNGMMRDINFHLKLIDNMVC